MVLTWKSYPYILQVIQASSSGKKEKTNQELRRNV